MLIKKRFAYTYTFFKYNINKFVLMLQKCAYPCKYLDDWKKNGEILIPEREYFYSSLNTKDITDVDYRHTKAV